MATLHVVSHTHWDREWYRTFQQFRFRLLHLVDDLLGILEGDPAYLHFMLDGQTAVLEDVLDVRPDLEERLRRQVQAGRVLIGPWFILPDEFLVSPEALVRNLLLGERICRAWGARMALGYTPDPFGHIGQLPQLLRGFGMDTAVFARGAGDAPVEFRWASPDGSEVLVCYLRDHYGNVAYLPADGAGVAQRLAEARDSLTPYARTSHRLLMQGTDHLFPRADLPRLLAEAASALPDRVLHSSLPAYVAAVRRELGAEGLAGLPLRRGEMRDPSRAHLLPGVLSTRMGIKQRNHACQTLLEKWAEPFAAFASGQVCKYASGQVCKYASGQVPRLADLHTCTLAYLHTCPLAIHRAWKYLLENHPHDSICGCSIDQVHREMVTRFDWCEQLGEEGARTALETLAAQVDTGAGSLPALVVFNPAARPRTDRVAAQVLPPVDPPGVRLLGPDGEEVPLQVVRRTARSEMELPLDRQAMALMVEQVIASGEPAWEGWKIRGLQVWRDGEVAHVTVAVTRSEEFAPPALSEEPIARLRALLADESVRAYDLRIREDEALEIAFVARDVPPLGLAAYRFAPADVRNPTSDRELQSSDSLTIENEFLIVRADAQSGRLTVTDRQTGWMLPGVHRLVDGGDRGDEYNYCQPEQDELVDSPAEPPTIRCEVGPAGQSLFIGLTCRVPAGLDPQDRSVRSAERVDLPVTVRVTLTPGVRRVDFETTVDNRAADHRLRVHFPAPLAVDSACAEGHWDVVEWPLALPTDTAGWAEQPAPTRPQRGWASVSDGQRGLTVANRGLPEVEVLRTADGVEVALTLLRCVGWLSRDDLHCRRGHAGPALTVPEAQCPGVHTFRYALIPHAGDWRAAFALAEAFQSDLRAVATGPHAGALPPRLSFLRLEPESLQVSAVKAADDGDGLIIRLWNVEEHPVEGWLRLWQPFARAVRCRMDERTEDDAVLAESTDTLRLTVRGREVVTLRVSLQAGAQITDHES